MNVKKRGFASMDPEKRREIAKKGAAALAEKGAAHRFTKEEAVAAGRKGGKRTAEKGSEYFSDLGKKGAAQRQNEEPKPEE